MRLIIFLGGATIIVMIAVLLVVIRLYYRKLKPGQALVISSSSGRQQRVSFSGALVLPIIQRADLIDVTTRIVAVELDGDQAPVTSDGVRVGIKVSFYIGVNHTAEDVLRVAVHFGCEQASDPEALAAFFWPKCVDALRQVVRQVDLEHLQQRPDVVRDQVVNVIGQDLNGFCLADVAIVRVDRAVNRPADEVGPFR